MRLLVGARAGALMVILTASGTLLANIFRENEVTVVNDNSPTRQLSKTSKEWTILVYMAADNNLSYFAWSNIKQMASVGSNNWINIIIQLNEPGNQKPTQRYLIEKDRAALLNAEQVNEGKKLDTGDPKTLIDFVTESYTQFPSKHLMLILWNHGTGCLDPFSAKTYNVSELFQLNPSDMMLELNRENSSTAPILVEPGRRGICFDETYHSYLTNQKLNYALNAICTKIKRKFDIIGLDACMMQMVEFCSLLSPYAQIAVGSQEVELGAGWNYKSILSIFNQPNVTSAELSKHITESYQRAYARLTHDYTLSAVDLTKIKNLEDNLDVVGSLLISCLKNQAETSVRQTLDYCRSKGVCTCFDEPSYVDLGHLYKNILANIKNFRLISEPETVERLHSKLEAGLNILKEIVFAKVTGKNLLQASGLSIYFPSLRVHSSYAQVPFACKNRWAHFVYEYLQKRPVQTINVEAPSFMQTTA